MKYYATVKHHSITGTWEELKATSLTAAKREATKMFGSGYIGHRIFLIERAETSKTSLNGIPAWTKTIGNNKWEQPHD